MNQLAQGKVDSISRASVSFKDKAVLVLDGVHGRAFDGFKQTLAKRGISLKDEVLVLFKDLTWFGGGEDGFLITDKRVYYHEWGFRCLEIAEIEMVRIGGLFDENIEFILKDGQIISLWLAKIFSEVKAVIEVLKSVDVAPTLVEDDRPMVHQVQCLGCRAIVRSNQNFCEYCRSPLG